MNDWNRYMADVFSKLCTTNIDKEKKKFLKELEKKTPPKKTHSEEMQDKLEPIPISCPMDSYYDDEGKQ